MVGSVSADRRIASRFLALMVLGAALGGVALAALADDGFEADRYYYFLMATYAELNRDDAAALKAMTKAAGLGRGSYQLKLEAARLCSRTGDGRKALKYAMEAMALEPEDPRAHLLTAWLAGSENDRETAEREYLKVLELTPDNPEALYWLGTLYFENRRHQEAEKFFKRLTSADPGAASFYYLGRFYLRLGRKEEAIGALNAALKKDPDFIDALDDLAGLYEEAGRHKSAEKTYRRLLEFKPQTARSGLARLLLKTGRRAEAERIVAESLRDDRRFHRETGLKADGEGLSDDLEIRLRLGQVYLEIRRYREAIGEFEAVLKARAGHERAAFSLATALMERQEAGGPAGAARAAGLLEAIRPESSLYVDARLLLISPVQGLDDRQSLALIEEALRLKPDSLRFHLAAAHFQERLGELDKARALLLRAVEAFG
ncbi:MAG: tetratricopeptide repeat protein, partial [Candidatus Adiutrix sp.]|nr:tetratricopeptide repeat protein [Candidatus Adiutrix sp.]